MTIIQSRIEVMDRSTGMSLVRVYCVALRALSSSKNSLWMAMTVLMSWVRMASVSLGAQWRHKCRAFGVARRA